MYILPSLLDWLPGLQHRNFRKLQVLLSKQIQRHREKPYPGEPRNFMDCLLDQMDKVQAPAILNSVHATHMEAPSTQQHPSPLSTGTERPSHFQEETLVMTTHNLFSAAETMNHPELSAPHSTQSPRGGVSASRKVQVEGARVLGNGQGQGVHGSHTSLVPAKVQAELDTLVVQAYLPSLEGC